jgi:hypothetical protein
MIGELVAVVALGFSGWGVLLWTSPRLPAAARSLLAFPIGAAVYMAVALAWAASTDRVEPAAALAVTGVIGLAGVAAGWKRSGWRQQGVGLAYVLSGIVVIVVTVRTVHMTALTPDSLRYLLFSVLLQGPEGLAAVHPPDLLNRQIGLPSLHALSWVGDRMHMASLGPVFGVSAFGFVAWLLWTQARADRRRLLIVVVAGAFLLSTNRFLYSWFYINTHIEMATFLLIGVVGIWLSAKEQLAGWGVPVGLALGAALLLRPDSPLFVAVLMVVAAAAPIGWRSRWEIAIPVTLYWAVWYGLILIPHPHYQSYLSPTAPVVGNSAAILGGVALMCLAGVPWVRRLARHLDAAMLVLMVLGFGFLAARNLEVVADSASATVMNIEFGFWLLTWPVLVGLTTVAVFRHRIPHGRVWTVSILGFGLLYWILPLLRDGAWRVGAGDSGNRLLIHFVAVVVAYVVLAAFQHDDEPVTA